KQMLELAQGVAELFGQKMPEAKLDEKARLYLVGERKPGVDPALEAMVGIPLCRRVMTVYDLRNAELAAAYFNPMEQNLQKQFQGGKDGPFAVKGEVVRLNVPGADGAFAVRLALPDGQTKIQSWARSGPYLLFTDDEEPQP